MRKKKRKGRNERKIGKTKEMREIRVLRQKEKKTKGGSDSRCSDNQNSLVRELKLVYSMRDTSRYQKQKRYSFLIHWFLLI